jgi:sarcosine oxidase/L-pipecolate oxidase
MLLAYYTFSEAETQSIIDSKMPVVVISGQVDIIPPRQPTRTLKINNLQPKVFQSIITRSETRITAPPQIDQASVPTDLARESAEVMRKAMPQFTSTHRLSQ